MAEKSFDELLTDLKSDDIETRRVTLHHLGKLDDTRVPQALIAALNDKEIVVRLSAINAIADRHTDPAKYSYSLYPFKSLPESSIYVEPLIDYLNREDDSQNI